MNDRHNDLPCLWALDNILWILRLHRSQHTLSFGTLSAYISRIRLRTCRRSRRPKAGIRCATDRRLFLRQNHHFLRNKVVCRLNTSLFSKHSRKRWTAFQCLSPFSIAYSHHQWLVLRLRRSRIYHRYRLRYFYQNSRMSSSLCNKASCRLLCKRQSRKTIELEPDGEFASPCLELRWDASHVLNRMQLCNVEDICRVIWYVLLLKGY